MVYNSKKIFFTYLFIANLLTTSYSTCNSNNTRKYDLTLVGMISFQSACKLTGLWIDHLINDCSINYISTGLTNLQFASEVTRKVAQNPDKTPGTVAILLDNVIWTPDYSSYSYMPNSFIKIALSMLEATKMIPQCVEILNENFDAVIVPDEYWINIYRESGITIPIFVLPCGLYLDNLLEKPFREETGHPFIFGFSAAFWYRKNQELVLEAFAQEFTGPEQNNVKLLLHGRGGHQEIIDSLINTIKTRNLNAEIHIGYFNDQTYEDFLALLDCYILVSRAEGYSISPREAMAAGIPCILSNNTAHITLCNSGYVLSVPSNIPVEPDQYESLAGKVDRGVQFTCSITDIRKAMREMYENYKAYKEKARHAREWVKQYRFATLKAKHLNFINPKKIILGDYNKVDDDYLMTNDIKLYNKYLQILH